MKIVCDACQAKYSIADEKIQGKAFKIRCKKCNHIIVVKTGSAGSSGGDGPAAPAATEKPKAAAPAAAAPAQVAAPAPVAETPVWHVVIDGEQVGPLTEAEVKDRLRQGKINSDTLVWKEGFADWMQMSTAPELSALLAKTTLHPSPKAAAKEPAKAAVHEPAKAAAKEPAKHAVHEPAKAAAPAKADKAPAAAPVAATSSSMFSGVSAQEADPFAAPTVITPAGTADLFASQPVPSQAVPAQVAPAPSSPFLFGGASGQASEPVVTNPSPGNGMGGTHLTGQRNENSVLFSLSNLEALAVPSKSAGIKPPSSTSNTEGSGLIDIRSMAAMTLSEGGGEAHRHSDSLPTFSTPQFSPVAPVLLPMSTSGPPKWVYPVLGLLGVGILILGYGIYKVVTAPPPGTPVVVVAPPAPPPPPAPAQPAPNAAPGTPPSEAAPAAPSDNKPTAAEEKPAEKGKGGASSKGDKKHGKGSDQGSSSKGSAPDGKKVADAPTPTTAPTPAADTGKTQPKKGKGTLDDLLGEVGSKKGSGDDGSKPSVKLVTLTQSDIVNAMKGVQPKVQACANQFKAPGTAMATISVANGGKVNTVTVTGKFAGSPTASCLEAAAKTAKFPACQSMTFPWPFTLSPR